jgi:hypothetical protein
MGKIDRDIFKTMLVTNNLSAEKTVKAAVEGYHRAFQGSVFVGDRWYVFYCYVNGTHHSYGGVIVCNYSDDFGATWSDDIPIYTGEEVIAAHPEWLVENPRNTQDARDATALVMPDGTILLICTVCIGYNWQVGDEVPGLDQNPVNVDYRFITKPYITSALKIPLNEGGDGLDLDNVDISYITQTGGSICSAWLKDGVVYAPSYGYPTEYGREMKLYKSSDYGVTWAVGGEIFERGDEGAMYFIGETLYVAARPVDNGVPGLRKKSTDYGVTWDEGVNNPIRLDGLKAITMPNGCVFIHGRENEFVYKTTGYVLKGETLNAPIHRLVIAGCMDTGYGVSLKAGGKYFFTWHNGPKRTFGTYLYPTGWTGIYFKEIDSNVFELLAY